MKKIKNKKKKIYKFLGVLVSIVLIVLYILNIRIKNIYVKNNYLLSDQEVIELAGIEKYPKLFSISTRKMINKIKMSQIVESVKIKKNIFGRVDIEINEYNMLLKDEVDKGIYLASGEKIKTDEVILGIPSLINVADQDILKEFLKKLDKVDKDMLANISEIEFTPNEYEKDLFLLYMNDGNYVYITTLKLHNLNKYGDVLKQLDGKKGILYLDSGNHFKVME